MTVGDFGGNYKTLLSISLRARQLKEEATVWLADLEL